jgi:proton-dependent oligopeptide transporter, POT family
MSQSNTGHPKGLYVLFVTEMWERFSYYGMRAIFVLFMAKALLFDKSLGSQIYGSYTGLVYLTPLLGGYMADRYWGNRKSIIIGGILMAIGQFFMFIAGSFYQESFAPMIMFVGLGYLGMDSSSQIFRQWLVSCTRRATNVLTLRSPFSTWELTSVRS